MIGIDNLKKLTKFVVLLANAIDKSTRDGLSFADAGNFIPALMEAPKAFENIGELSAEIKDLDAEEIKELKVLISQELNLVDKDLEDVINHALRVLVDIKGLYLAIKGLKDA
jgi:hypothetical protein